MKQFAVSACALMVACGAAMAQPDVNGAALNTRVFNDFAGSTLTTINNYPNLISFTDGQMGAGNFANRHNWRFSDDGGATNAQFANDDRFSFFSNVTLSGSGHGEGGIQISPWWSPNVDGQMNLRTTDGEVAVFGGRLPFYSFTGDQGVHYTKGETVRVGMEYQPRDLNAANPARIKYWYGALNSGWINFDMGNPAEDPPHGLFGILNPATAGGFVQVFGLATGSGSLTAEFTEISYVPAPTAAALLGLGGLLAARRRR